MVWCGKYVRCVVVIVNIILRESFKFENIKFLKVKRGI